MFRSCARGVPCATLRVLGGTHGGASTQCRVLGNEQEPFHHVRTHLTRAFDGSGCRFSHWNVPSRTAASRYVAGGGRRVRWRKPRRGTLRVRCGRPANDLELRRLGRGSSQERHQHQQLPADQDRDPPHRVRELHGPVAGARIRAVPEYPADPLRQWLDRQRPALHAQPRRPYHRGQAPHPGDTGGRIDVRARRALHRPEQHRARHRKRGHLHV